MAEDDSDYILLSSSEQTNHDAETEQAVAPKAGEVSFLWAIPDGLHTSKHMLL